ncbi:MAG: acyl-CoA carboxylase subunit beta [Myxococcota bacterium]
MSWQPEVDEIERRRARAREHGGREAVERQHRAGRLAIRERIERLVDAESFRELGGLAGQHEPSTDGTTESFTPANYVLGTAQLDGRRCVVGGEDFTLRGGSPSPAGLRKSIFAEELALRLRLPLVRLLEGAGGSVPRPGASSGPPSAEAVNAPPRFASFVETLANVPVVSAALGPVAGFPAARLVSSHFAVMTRETAQVMIGGPALVERALGLSLTKQELGGARVHARSGVVDRVAADEDEAFDLIRRFLTYLPTNVWEAPPVRPSEDEPDRRAPELLEIVPRERRRVYPMRRLLELVLDRDSFFELAPEYGPSQITGLARLDGHPVGVLANDPRFYAGAMTADGALKLRRFVDLCDAFGLPIVSFVDEPGFMIGPAAERAATIRHGATALFAVVQSSVPWASVIVRKVYGVAGAAHFGPGGHVLAWPSAETGALPVEGGVAVAFRREIAEAPDPDRRRRELEEQLAAGRSPFPRAEAFGVHDLIDPRETRPALCAWLQGVWPCLADRLGPRRCSYRP